VDRTKRTYLSLSLLEQNGYFVLIRIICFVYQTTFYGCPTCALDREYILIFPQMLSFMRVFLVEIENWGPPCAQNQSKLVNSVRIESYIDPNLKLL
jgi:hypothetical protein